VLVAYEYFERSTGKERLLYSLRKLSFFDAEILNERSPNHTGGVKVTFLHYPYQLVLGLDNRPPKLWSIGMNFKLEDQEAKRKDGAMDSLELETYLQGKKKIIEKIKQIHSLPYYFYNNKIKE